MTTLEAIELALRRAGLTETDSTYQGQMREYLTLACRDIEAAATWWWLFKSSTFATTAITGTYVAATNGSTSITCVDESGDDAAGWSSATAGMFIYIGGTKYTLSTVSNSSTPHTATISSAFAGTTTTATSCSIYQDEYALASDCVRPLSFRDITSNHTLKIVSAEKADSVDPESDDTGTPEWVYIAGADSSTGYVSVGIYPIPDAAYTIAYRYYATVTDFTTTHDSWDLRQYFGIPTELQHAMVFAAARYYQQQLGDDEGSMVNFAEYSRALKMGTKNNGLIQGNRPYRMERPGGHGRLFQPQEGSLS